MEATDLLSKLNDRSLGFPSRCSIAASLLNPQKDAEVTWSFPRKNQYIFDWFTGSLIKLARASPRPEIFLSKKVWDLMKVFSDILISHNSAGSSLSLKRPLSFITNDDEFFDYKKSFDPQSFVIKCPLLSIFQVSLSFLSIEVTVMDFDDSLVDSDTICPIILTFLKQNRVSLPVSFSQVTEFIRSLVQSRSKLSSASFCQVLSPTLGILTEIILGGTANYKKTYPLLVKFCLQSPTESSEEEKEIWISFIEKCLFSSEFIDELLNFMTSPAMIKALNSFELISEASFPKSLTFQRCLFIELSTESLAIDSCPLIYEAFLRSSGSKINREAGFNFFTFLLKKCLISTRRRNDQLAKLISILQSRGNEIYQQRNDEIYHKQSSIIEEIFTSAMACHSSAYVDSMETDTLNIIPYNLLLSIAKLNYYLVSEKLEEIFSINSESADLINFIIGIFELAGLANQLPILLKTILKSNLPLSILKSPKLISALMKIFRNSLSPFSLHQIYMSLISEDSNTAALLMLIPVMRSIVKVIDNIESFDKDKFTKFQLRLLERRNDDICLNLLSEIVRWSPGTFLLIDYSSIITNEESLPYSDSMLNLLFTLKSKNLSSRVSVAASGHEILILKYLPIIAEDLTEEELKSFSRWLLENEIKCLSALSEAAFFEIIPLRNPFLCELISYIKAAESKSDFITKVIERLPWEYLSDEFMAELIKCLWWSPSNVSQLLMAKNRKDTLKILSGCEEFINFLMYDCSNEDLISKCFQIEHSIDFVRRTLMRLNIATDVIFKTEFVSKMMKYLSEAEDIVIHEFVNFIEIEIDPINLLKRRELLSIALLDALDTILEWTLNNSENKEEFAAKCILQLPKSDAVELEISVRCQALKCKFPASNDLNFIEDSVELASKLDPSDSPAVVGGFKKDLISLIKGLPVENIKQLIGSFIITTDPWKFALGLQAINQLLHVTTAAPAIFSLFQMNIEIIYEKSIKFDLTPIFLASLKSIIQLKKNVTWESEIISNILGILRQTRQSRPQCYEEIFTILRLIVSLHIRKFRTLLSLLVLTICESFCGISSVEESAALGRLLTELGSQKRTELEPFALLPLLYAFISTKYESPVVKKPVQLAMTSLMYHLGTRKQLLQLLSTALVSEHEHRLILKAFIDEYNKFHKYSGRS